MGDWTFTKGLHEIGDGAYAYLQPNGSWGWSNAGLVVSGGRSLLVDTLFDLSLTREMLTEMRRVEPATQQIETLVNTHGNGDHCWGNELVAGAEIVASRRAAAEMRENPPGRVATLMRVARVMVAGGRPLRAFGRLLGRLGLRQLGGVAEAAPFAVETLGSFDFKGITLTPPTRTFDDRLELQVGDKTVELIEVGPAHTQGDILVHSPADRTLFSGDILFIHGHPLVWEGPVANWIRACELILEMDVDTIVPGHGPITDKDGVREVKGYLEHLSAEARQRFEAGMSAADAAADINLDAYRHWVDGERVAVNVETLYRDFTGSGTKPDVLDSFVGMARVRRRAASG